MVGLQSVLCDLGVRQGVGGAEKVPVEVHGRTLCLRLRMMNAREEKIQRQLLKLLGISQLEEGRRKDRNCARRDRRS